MESGERRNPRDPGREYVYHERKSGRAWIPIVETILLFALGVGFLAALLTAIGGCAVDRGCTVECVECGKIRVDCRMQGETVKPQ